MLLANVLGRIEITVDGADSDAKYSSIGKDENGSDGVDIVLNLSHNVTFILLTMARIGETRCIESEEVTHSQ